jgi:hypothetical protein
MARETHGGISEQAKASRHRWDDALVLRGAARYRGGMYLAGYSIECLLKTRLMRIHRCQNLEGLEKELIEQKLLGEASTVYTHHLEGLIGLAGGRDRLRADAILWRKFNIVNRWLPAWRYNPDLSGEEEADRFFEAARAIRDWIEHNT